MPELPEVEGARRRLSPLIAGKALRRLEVIDGKLWRPSEGLSPEIVAGRTVLALERRAKLLLFRLEGGLSLVLHLKIAGQLVYVLPDGQRLVGGHPYPLPDAALPDPSSRFRLDFAPASPESASPKGEPPRIVRELLAGRGTYYCPVCQPAPADVPGQAVSR